MKNYLLAGVLICLPFISSAENDNVTDKPQADIPNFSLWNKNSGNADNTFFANGIKVGDSESQRREKHKTK